MRGARFVLVSGLAIVLPLLAACGENDDVPYPAAESVSSTGTADTTTTTPQRAHPGLSADELRFFEKADRYGHTYDSDEQLLGLARQVCTNFSTNSDSKDAYRVSLKAVEESPINSNEDDEEWYSALTHSFLYLAVESFCPELRDTLKAAEDVVRWSKTPTPTTPVVPTLRNGKFLVGYEAGQAQPGTYTIAGQVTDCYWERSDAQGEILDNNFVSIAPSLTVTILESDAGFTSEGCGSWTKVD